MQNRQLTLNNKLNEIYAHPVGHDVIERLLTQMGAPAFIVDNPLIGGLRLKHIKALLGKKLGADFFDAVLTLLNSEPDAPSDKPAVPEQAWWKEAVFYQIYPRSFMDSNGDGVGDLRGIISKLDYLKELGVNAVWLSPIYDSPLDDNGYDIRDYRKILPQYGSMEDFDGLLDGLHRRGMRLIMDMVLNHTSDEHQWFAEALGDEASPYRDFYFFRKTTDGNPPNNWTSFFSGSAWDRYKAPAVQSDAEGIWALHLFSKKQMDLNWDSEELREAVYEMVRFWLDKGVDGFRLDVINYISKPGGLPDGNGFIGSLMGYTGIEHYFYGPRLHEYLRELREKALAPYGAFTVGETPGVGQRMGRLLTDGYRGELDLIFSFDHLETPGHTRFDDYTYDLDYLRRFYTRRLGLDMGHGWDTLFYDNHDNPRMLSKIDPTGRYHYELAKLLAVLQMTLRGTPFIYQGQELGAVNKKFTSIDDLRDVESINLYNDLISPHATVSRRAPAIKAMPPDEAFRRVLAGTRDHARTPMQWNGGKNGGFTNGQPWIKTDGDEKLCNAETQMDDDSSVFRFYQRLIALRRTEKALIYGITEYIGKRTKGVMRYVRRLEGEAFYVEMNLRPAGKKHKPYGKSSKLVLSSCDGEGSALGPYEARIYKLL